MTFVQVDLVDVLTRPRCSVRGCIRREASPHGSYADPDGSKGYVPHWTGVFHFYGDVMPEDPSLP